MTIFVDGYSAISTIRTKFKNANKHIREIVMLVMRTTRKNIKLIQA